MIHQDEMYASISNAVTLPSFTRVDGAVFFTLNDTFEAQLNVENLFDEDYFAHRPQRQQHHARLADGRARGADDKVLGQSSKSVRSNFRMAEREGFEPSMGF